MAKKQTANSTEEEVVVTRSARKPKEDEKQAKAKPASVKAPRKSRLKETFSELKKVSWPTFGKTMKQTGMVLSVVLLFGVLVLGLDLLISFIIDLLTSI